MAHGPVRGVRRGPWARSLPGLCALSESGGLLGGCVLRAGVHAGHLLHWADMRRGALNRWARLLIFAVFFGVDVVYSYAGQVSATIHLAGFVVGVVLRRSS